MTEQQTLKQFLENARRYLFGDTTRICGSC